MKTIFRGNTGRYFRQFRVGCPKLVLAFCAENGQKRAGATLTHQMVVRPAARPAHPPEHLRGGGTRQPALRPRRLVRLPAAHRSHPRRRRRAPAADRRRTSAESRRVKGGHNRWRAGCRSWVTPFYAGRFNGLNGGRQWKGFLSDSSSTPHVSIARTARSFASLRKIRRWSCASTRMAFSPPCAPMAVPHVSPSKCVGWAICALLH